MCVRVRACARRVLPTRMCDCPFCTYVPPTTTLPLPVRIALHPHPHFAIWGWLTAVDRKRGFGIRVVDHRPDRVFFDHAELVRACLRHFPAIGIQKDANINVSVSNIRVRVPDPRGDVALLEEFPRVEARWSGELPPSSVGGAVCEATLPPWEVMEDEQPAAPHRPAKRPRKVAGRTSPSRPPRSPARAGGAAGGAYDPMSIGGDRADMRQVATVCKVWDAETVTYVLDHGGRPPLVDVTGGTRLDLMCTFRAPDGTAVSNVVVSRNLVALLYGDVAGGH